MDIYELARWKGKSEKEARDHANSTTSPLRIRMWRNFYELSRWAGFSKDAAMKHAYATTPLRKAELLQVESLVEVKEISDGR
jgi:hypothetical protein